MFDVCPKFQHRQGQKQEFRPPSPQRTDFGQFRLQPIFLVLDFWIKKERERKKKKKTKKGKKTDWVEEGVAAFGRRRFHSNTADARLSGQVFMWNIAGRRRGFRFKGFSGFREGGGVSGEGEGRWRGGVKGRRGVQGREFQGRGEVAWTFSSGSGFQKTV